MAAASATVSVTPEMISAYLWGRDHLIRRGTEDYARVLDIVRHKTYVLDEHARRINGRYIKVAYIQNDEQGRPIATSDEVKVKWKRVRIPKTHPWRGKAAPHA
ncbi:hypothetical protein NYS48_09645 [Curtobacterium flaccumfaciens pv. flaccumfaciens]|uniref:hypothetical protein n=1 Tax=Curtobacterium poinsettiae TaxID=159612 RepID=UPI00217EB7AD|nr:hypothetical protein [Curtobacterium flaccumfaciens]MCS6565575.1 hypothetical protein [Curtobacterium flaccumfaciens pv. flaccumfaciens]